MIETELIQNTEDILLPCPFCGGNAAADALETIALYWYECQSCGGASGSGEDWMEAKQKWNSRK